MTVNIEEFAGLIPDSVLAESGKVFVSGRNAFGSPSKLYFYGLNPGGAPETYAQETVRSHTDMALHDVPDNWPALTCEAWGQEWPSSKVVGSPRKHGPLRMCGELCVGLPRFLYQA